MQRERERERERVGERHTSQSAYMEEAAGDREGWFLDPDII